MGSQITIYFQRIISNSDKLKSKEKDILIKRLQGLTLTKIGKKLHLSYERIRQIEKQAIKKLSKGIIQLSLFKKKIASKQKQFRQ